MTQEKIDLDEILVQVKESLTEGDWDEAVKIIESLRPPDQADVFNELPSDTQVELLPRLDPEDSADILEELEDEEAAELATRLDKDELVRIVDRMEPDEAADLLGDIPPEQVTETLTAIEDADEIKPLLQHEDNTAGGLMTSAKVVLHKKMTIQEALDYLREIAPDTETIYYLFVVDDDNRLVGVVSLRNLVIADPTKQIGDILDQEVISVTPETDQEDAARLMARYDLLALPVIDKSGHLLGLITHDDLVDVLEDEATEDIYRLGGVPEEQPADAPVKNALKTRLPWLVLNLGTAMASVTVLSLFEDTIAQVAVLAAFFPIVAGVSGSAGTQTLTVIVRGLALGEIEFDDGLKALTREILIGIANGIVIGTFVAIIAYVWKGAPVLGLVVGAATLLNMITAGIAGVIVPLGVTLLKIDPALASPILVSTITDSMGYLIYLGLATAIIVNYLG